MRTPQYHRAGERMTLTNYNALVDKALEQRSRPARGIQSGEVAGQRDSRDKDDSIVAYSEDEVPEYSVFGITGLPDEALVAPTTVQVQQVLEHGSPMILYTNGSCVIPSEGQGTAKPLNKYSLAKVACDPDDPPVAGMTCGPKPGDWTVCSKSFGLVCHYVESDGEEGSTSDDETGSFALVSSGFEAGAFLMKVTEKVTAFAKETETLGKGKAKVFARDADAETLSAALSPADASSDWIHDVYSEQTDDVDEGDLVLAVLVVGVGLVIVAPPKVVNVVQPYDYEKTKGEGVDADECKYAGRIVHFDMPDDEDFCSPYPFSGDGDCWIVTTNDPMRSGVKPLPNMDNYLGFFLGKFGEGSGSSEVRPVYAIRDDVPHALVSPGRTGSDSTDDEEDGTETSDAVKEVGGLVRGHALVIVEGLPFYSSDQIFDEDYPCYLYVLDYPTGGGTTEIFLPRDQRYWGRYVGYHPANGQPIFAVNDSAVRPLVAKYSTGGSGSEGSGSSSDEPKPHVARGGSASFRVWYGPPGEEEETSLDVTAYVGIDAVDDSGIVWIENNGHGWYVIASTHYAMTIDGLITENVDDSFHAATCSVLDTSNGVNPGASIKVHSVNSDLYVLTVGLRYEARYDRDSGLYKFNWVECTS